MVPPASGTNTPQHATRNATGPVLIIFFRSVVNPAENMNKSTTISAICMIRSEFCTNPSILGPMISPATISPATWGALIFRAKIPKYFAVTSMMARSRKIL